ncbi:hypothetical protein IFM89_032380 [Coptis chinensis]|uniref:Uncharacterized protein n=1 Tax=Coptis chinensis TaxID=261450 RepID=A0A835HZD2_9MAGN|nr:hypothetical protein IFM89_032380 [Coptis chinensis]
MELSKPNKTMVVTNTYPSYSKALFESTAIGYTGGMAMGFATGYPASYWGTRMGVWFGLSRTFEYGVGKMRHKQVDDVWTKALCSAAAAGCTFKIGSSLRLTFLCTVGLAWLIKVTPKAYY